MNLVSIILGVSIINSKSFLDAFRNATILRIYAGWLKSVWSTTCFDLKISRCRSIKIHLFGCKSKISSNSSKVYPG